MQIMKSFRPNCNYVDFISSFDFTSTHHVSPECSTRLRPHAFGISYLVMIWELVPRRGSLIRTARDCTKSELQCTAPSFAIARARVWYSALVGAQAADVMVFVIGTYFLGFRTEWSIIVYLYFAFSHRRTDLYYFFTVAWK